MKGFFEELKNRRVYRVALAYIVVGSAVVQLAGTIFPTFHAPDWVQQTFVVLVALGFPTALVLAWFFDVEAGQIKAAPGGFEASVKGRRVWMLAAVGLLIAAAGLAIYWTWQSGRTGFAASTRAAADIPKKSIAVLPFENLSTEKENAYFAQGMADEILIDLAKIADLKVISRTSAMQYGSGAERNLREIAQQLHVANILEGSVQRVGGRVRVSAQLIDALTDNHLWAERYDRPLGDVFVIQSEIARAIADQLKARLSSSERAVIAQKPTDDVDAYDLYVRARILRANTTFDTRSKGNLVEAARLLEQAVERDPKFFLAYCRLAEAHDLIYFLGTNEHTPAQLARAESAIKSALQLRPDAGEAHLALGEHLYRAYRDYDRALVELAVAQKSLPNEPLVFELTGLIQRRRGNWEQSTRDIERALDLDPRNLYLLQQLSITYETQRRYRDMAAVLDRALNVAPSDANTRVVRALVDLEERADTKPLHNVINALVTEDPDAAKRFSDEWLYLALCERDDAAATRALAAIPSDGIAVGSTWFPKPWCEAIAALARGDKVASRAAFTAARAALVNAFRQQPDYAQALSALAMIEAALGNKQEALRDGQRAVNLLPISKDVLDGTDMLIYLAVTYAWAGEKERALEQLTALTKIPAPLNYGQLKLHPYWDSLRSDPRFEQVLAAVAPK